MNEFGKVVMSTAMLLSTGNIYISQTKKMTDTMKTINEKMNAIVLNITDSDEAIKDLSDELQNESEIIVNISKEFEEVKGGLNND